MRLPAAVTQIETNGIRSFGCLLLLWPLASSLSLFLRELCLYFERSRAALANLSATVAVRSRSKGARRARRARAMLTATGPKGRLATLLRIA